ncbi:MAG: hypothetical protein JWP91_645 [Fibrobacteres bacterium]|nr:hypothetical protein [Fibrobacterota bacterium]
MSAWKSTLLLPTLFHSAASPYAVLSGKPGAGTASKADAGGPTPADVCGLWSRDEEYGRGNHVTVETFFAADGTFETRTYLGDGGQVERLHGFGTWALRKDCLVTMPSPDRCRTVGDLTDGWGDATSERVRVGMRGGEMALILDIGTLLGRYASPGRAFTLPDLFTSERGGTGLSAHVLHGIAENPDAFAFAA